MFPGVLNAPIVKHTLFSSSGVFITEHVQFNNQTELNSFLDKCRSLIVSFASVLRTEYRIGAMNRPVGQEESSTRFIVKSSPHHTFLLVTGFNTLLLIIKVKMLLE